MDPDWENPNGVPISAFVFGGRRFSTIPLITEASNWEQGVFLASLVAADHVNGNGIRTVRESMAMIPYCAYNITEYYEQWLKLSGRLGYNAPKIFFVNWFRKDEKGNLMWPGFGENSRVLKWIAQRIEQRGEVVKIPTGLVPTIDSLDLRSLEIRADVVRKLLEFNPQEWKQEMKEIHAFFAQLGSSIPEAFKAQMNAIEAALK
jgi:phosphoenolpyruvate carboxykinase (GTP)